MENLSLEEIEREIEGIECGRDRVLNLGNTDILQYKIGRLIGKTKKALSRIAREIDNGESDLEIDIYWASRLQFSKQEVCYNSHSR
ncbi:MAG: hypothetical protein WC548_04020 [Candidatus Pacearchaeota archaeon]